MHLKFEVETFLQKVLNGSIIDWSLDQETQICDMATKAQSLEGEE